MVRRIKHKRPKAGKRPAARKKAAKKGKKK
jgi:hypothetical protein